ncbi:MAG: hypothetical protein LBL72_10750 [Candidatus Accumulibacter sp.]|jgi:hypothetical protein|nr:hypothetical protein [Accumulibacter sp.]
MRGRFPGRFFERLCDLIALLLIVLLLAACGTTTRQLPSSGKYLLPNASLRVTPQIDYTVEQIGLAAAVVGIAYLIYDPLAPNWEIEEQIINDDTYHFSLRAKSFRVGGDGESLRIIRRRAFGLQRERGSMGYRVLSYSEGIDSATPLTSRVSEGMVQLVGLPPPPPPPAPIPPPPPPTPPAAPPQSTPSPAASAAPASRRATPAATARASRPAPTSAPNRRARRPS